ncbi:carboxymuconolactone decarboxylase family protein [Caballeronia sp. dw_19]|uniref:carboxymuconolactone decarboxylase family protein n=1 Tax=Caballeronia sp. dw_19 TaxID=2719791 RepID=UPI001BD339D5|nr:carboxymuconolactone decarboxylase family protein [Caballeronia sp. dw_19]
MSRIDNIGKQGLEGRALEVFEIVERDYGAFGNMLGVLAHRPASIEHIYGLLQSAKDALITRRHLEIVLVTASRENQCQYCVSHHAPKLGALGIDTHTVENILDLNVPGLDPVERLVRDYASAVTRQRVTDRLVERLREHFSQEQVVELTLRASLYAFFARFNEALEIEVEEDVAGAPAH